ncbi:hypothetical protein DdX_18793 [Ditylenchus destructor]|uniref:Uncharacterized protein n=1 Tax=Ditylenchus destructor TaxID=166010 RepID=A0AAD4MJL0_9BILA|nr:hypothetical protein DdX_18793 [Ditylenchus destructor]
MGPIFGQHLLQQNKDKRMNHHIPQNQQPEPSHHIFKQPFTAACVTTDNDSKGMEIVLTADAQLDDEQEVLFLSKEIMVFNPAHPDKLVSALAIFDNASNRSYSSDEINEHLYPHGPSDIMMKVCSFGSSRATTYGSRKLQLGIMLQDGSHMVITVRSIPGKKSAKKKCSFT